MFTFSEDGRCTDCKRLDREAYGRRPSLTDLLVKEQERFPLLSHPPYNRAHNALRDLWSSSVGSTGYDKSRWIELESAVRALGQNSLQLHRYDEDSRNVQVTDVRVSMQQGTEEQRLKAENDALRAALATANRNLTQVRNDRDGMLKKLMAAGKSEPPPPTAKQAEGGPSAVSKATPRQFHRGPVIRYSEED